jgi:hypothetical protein
MVFKIYEYIIVPAKIIWKAILLLDCGSAFIRKIKWLYKCSYVSDFLFHSLVYFSILLLI